MLYLLVLKVVSLLSQHVIHNVRATLLYVGRRCVCTIEVPAVSLRLKSRVQEMASQISGIIFSSATLDMLYVIRLLASNDCL